MNKIRVLVVDDHSIVREGVKALLELERDLEVVGTASSGLEALELAETLAPDLLLMDLKMPGVGGIEACRLVKHNNLRIKVVLLTNYDDEEFVLEAIKAEADGYVLKDVKKGDLARIIRQIMQDAAYIDPMVTRKVLRHVAAQGRPAGEEASPRSQLSHRELQVLASVVGGGTNKEIAEDLCLSLDTVKSHMKNIYSKLGVRSRSQAIKAALQEGLVSLPR